ncbi:hypothetical protein [Streptomyces sp. NPDC046985]|uniref:hypothetical protein n=1 Tax=Streptomyces sp. NPDC046985 TaxID=3155377 RepID=UPI003403124A
MGTAGRRERTTGEGVGPSRALWAPQAPVHDIPAADGRREPTAGARGAADVAEEVEAAGQTGYRTLWIEEPARRRRLPDPVRRAAVRALLIISVTLIQTVVAFLCTLAGTWPALPLGLSSVASIVVATWAALDVWVTRQAWSQRNGVVSAPNSTARSLRRERRSSRREQRTTRRSQERIHRRRSGAGRLSHS